MATIIVDSRGTACPGPITDLIRAYRKAANGDLIELLATDVGIKSDAKAWCERTRNELVGITEDAGTYKAVIRIVSKRGMA
ncbi:MAG: sulfurtransferase TusA family protein [Thaumarchaeota archaeon]|nr:sulfurtransferase TusA family protein [Nitrososphaerota archaeon]